MISIFKTAVSLQKIGSGVCYYIIWYVTYHLKLFNLYKYSLLELVLKYLEKTIQVFDPKVSYQQRWNIDYANHLCLIYCERHFYHSLHPKKIVETKIRGSWTTPQLGHQHRCQFERSNLELRPSPTSMWLYFVMLASLTRKSVGSIKAYGSSRIFESTSSKSKSKSSVGWTPLTAPVCNPFIAAAAAACLESKFLAKWSCPTSGCFKRSGKTSLNW